LNGAVTDGVSGAASAPAMTFTGTPYAAGTATTNKALILVEDAATSTGWNTSGTYLGINAKTGFTGNLLDAQLNGVSKFKVDSTGKITGDGSGLTSLNASNLGSG